jgi:hypothetical protein
MTAGPTRSNCSWSGGDRRQEATDRISDLHQRNLSLLLPKDVIVASYPGSGAALVGNLLLELGLNYVDPSTEALLPDGTSVATPEHLAYRRRLAATSTRDASTGSSTRHRVWPRFVKSHLHERSFQHPVARLWLLVRDPRDALYSWFQWRIGFGEESWDKVSGSFEDFLGRPDFDGRTPVADWSFFYAGWSARASHVESSVVIRFEDLKRAPAEVVGGALRAVGVSVDAEELQGAAARSSYEAMRAHEDGVVAEQTGGVAPIRVLRSGQTEGWKRWWNLGIAHHFSFGPVLSVAQQFGYELSGPGSQR